MPGFQHTERETWECGEGLGVYRRSQHSGGLLAPALRNQGPGGHGLVCQDVPRVKTRVQPYEIKDPSVGKDRGQEEKKASEDGMAGWHHRRSGRELGNLWEMVKDREACHAAVHGLQLKESDITEQLNNSNVKLKRLFPWKETMANLKSRDFTLLTKVHIVKATVFLVVIYGCESWTKKKDERSRSDAFELWCWRRLLRVPWTARRSNQSILKEISPGCSWKD